MDTAAITSGDIAAEIKSQSEAASPAVERTTEETTQPAITAPAVVDEHGPIPFERHEAILGKTRREADEKLSRLSWAEGLTPEEVKEALAIQRLYRTNPERLAAHLSERVKTSAEPQPDVKDERGDRYYSPEQAAKWATWKSQQDIAALRAEMDERYGPIERTFTEQQRYSDANAQIDQAMNWPGFDEYMPDITAAVTAARARGESITLADAYIRAGVPRKIAERSTANLAEEKKKWLAELNSTTERVQDDVNPSRVPAASRKRDEDKTTAEMLREEIDRRKSA